MYPKKNESEGERYRKFRQALDDFHNQVYMASDTWLDSPGLAVFYEAVHRHRGTQACHVYGGLLAQLKTWCLDHGVACSGVGVGQIKKFWTGKGNATKDDMIAEARLRGHDPVDDNEADALALLYMRLVEGPDIGETPRKRRTKVPPAEPGGRRVAGRAARRLRNGDGVLFEGVSKPGAPDPLPEQEGAGGDGRGRYIHLDKVDG